MLSVFVGGAQVWTTPRPLVLTTLRRSRRRAVGRGRAVDPFFGTPFLFVASPRESTNSTRERFGLLVRFMPRPAVRQRFAGRLPTVCAASAASVQMNPT